MKKRLVSTITVGALIAAQAAMPVMAADGTVNVDVTERNPIIRVEVPTALEMAVDQFETVEKGTQIYSENFTIENKSAVAVKVSVTSAATLAGGASDATLVSKISEVNPATPSANGNLWLAVAAQTSDGKYIEEAGKTVGDLTQASANVETFDATNKNAEQDFYLAKGSGSEEYKFFDDSATDAEIPAYAQFYELTKITKDNDGTTDPVQGDLDAAIAAGDVYSATATDLATNGAALTKTAKGGTIAPASGTEYYKVSNTVSTPTLNGGKKYMYPAQATKGGSTAFRFIGKLEEAKATLWKKTDIGTVTIEYDIDGVPATTYDNVVGDCTYGLYSAPGTAMSAGAATGTVKYATADVSKVVSINMTNATGTYDAMVDSKAYSKATSSTSGADTTITFDSRYSGFYKGDVDATIVYEDAYGKTKTQVLTLDMGE